MQTSIDGVVGWESDRKEEPRLAVLCKNNTLIYQTEDMSRQAFVGYCVQELQPQDFYDC
jgi:hypothetical protein